MEKIKKDISIDVYENLDTSVRKCPECFSIYNISKDNFISLNDCAFDELSQIFVGLCNDCKQKITNNASGKSIKPREELTVYDLGLDTRTIHCLKWFGIVYVIELEKFTRKDLSKIRNFGNKSLIKLINLLALHGIFITNDISNPSILIDKTDDLIRILEDEIVILRKFLDETSKKTLSLKNHLNIIKKYVKDSVKYLYKNSKTDSTTEEQ